MGCQFWFKQDTDDICRELSSKLHEKYLDITVSAGFVQASVSLSTCLLTEKGH